MERDILHLAIPAFPIAVARVSDPALRGRPVAIAPGNSERALLQCVSAEARAEGVCEGMPVYRARRCSPSLLLRLPDPATVARAFRSILEIAGHYSPLGEPALPGRLYLDLTGSTRLLGPGRDAAARLERELSARLGLSSALGVAGNKLISCIAAGTLGHPGVCDVERGGEASFIAPLPVAALPGVGAARQALLLEELGLRRIGDLADLAVSQLRLAFGPFAPLLHQRARGIDPSPVQRPQRRAEIAEEAILARAENDDDILLAEVGRLAESCAFQLRRLGRGAGSLVLTLFYEDGVSEERKAPFSAPESRDRALLSAAEALFDRGCNRRVRIKGMRLLCRRLAGENRQLPLFAEEEVDPRLDALQGALDTLRRRHGMDVVRHAAAHPSSADF